MTREEKYMDKLMEQTYRVAQYGRRISHGQMVDSPHIVGLIATYRELADLLERVLEENGLPTHVDTLELPVRSTPAAAKEAQ